MRGKRLEMRDEAAPITPSRTDIVEFLATRLADPATQWSLGTFGAIAEFAREGDEPCALDLAGPVASAMTARGGVRIAPHADMRLVASETPTRESWSQRVALCLPENRCAMNRRSVLTELGPDEEALRAEDRPAILFDLGLDALQVDVCVRTGDPELVATLRRCTERPAFDQGHQAMGAILAASPHRVFISRLGRIEVYQPIPPANGKSPQGPHTHVLPKLLHFKRSHAATEPVPVGLVPCAHCYPAHPAKDAHGEPRAFDRNAHDAFQTMLRRFGDPELITLKARVAAAITAGDDPSAVSVTDKRFARASVRVALRQLAAAGERRSTLAAWIVAHDSALQAAAEAPDPYEHQA